jgi:hypothetical protein
VFSGSIVLTTYPAELFHRNLERAGYLESPHYEHLSLQPVDQFCFVYACELAFVSTRIRSRTQVLIAAKIASALMGRRGTCGPEAEFIRMGGSQVQPRCFKEVLEAVHSRCAQLMTSTQRISIETVF